MTAIDCLRRLVLVRGNAPILPATTIDAVDTFGFWVVVIAIAAIPVFVKACFVVAKRMRPEVVASFAAFAVLPLLVGLFGALWGLNSVLRAVVTSHVVVPRSWDAAHAAATALERANAGLVACVPAYLVLGIGWIIRVVSDREPRTS